MQGSWIWKQHENFLRKYKILVTGLLWLWVKVEKALIPQQDQPWQHIASKILTVFIVSPNFAKINKDHFFLKTESSSQDSIYIFEQREGFCYISSLNPLPFFLVKYYERKTFSQYVHIFPDQFPKPIGLLNRLITHSPHLHTLPFLFSGRRQWPTNPGSWSWTANFFKKVLQK